MDAVATLDLEAALLSGAVRALRRRAAAIRQRAAPGITFLDRRPPVVIVTSESAHALRIAKDFEAIADSLESAEAS